MTAGDDAGSQGALGALCTYAIGYSKYVTMLYMPIKARLMGPISKPGP